jgi:hypothetical protein
MAGRRDPTATLRDPASLCSSRPSPPSSIARSPSPTRCSGRV